ncbi:hypothetical protein SUGI_1192220 [Cryptomeria japonica]|nr:hypothetical protein SUGI_1192220 [Cryptomeria japonica]
METELEKEVAAFSLPDMTEPGHMSSFSSQLESSGVPFPASLQQHFSYSDLQLVVGNKMQQARVLDNGHSGDGDGDGEDEKKRDREFQQLHKKRSKNWSRVETLKLIKIRTDMDSRFARSGRKSELWDEIAETLQKGQFFRDAQQCRDKWEKLMASYKDVRDGLKSREDNPYYDELYPLLSGKLMAKEKDEDNKDLMWQKEFDHREQVNVRIWNEETEGKLPTFNDRLDDEEDEAQEMTCARKRKRYPRYVSGADVGVVKALLETLFSQQQTFFKELLESIERSEQAREQVRQEREEKWRAEEREHRNILDNAMIVLIQKLLDDKGLPLSSSASCGIPSALERQCQGPKKRSKNWKRGEVLHLIKLRGEMESRFAVSMKRAMLWEELAEALDSQGIKRDGKQCREKWDKLMAAYKDVIDGKKEKGDLPYFSELRSIVGGKVDDGTESDEFKDKMACIHIIPEAASERSRISG